MTTKTEIHFGVPFETNDEGRSSMQLSCCNLHELEDEVKRCTSLVNKNESDALYLAVIIGTYLNDAKRLQTTSKGRIRRKNWKAWLDANFSKGQRTASTYMRIASYWDGEILRDARKDGKGPTSIAACLRLLPKADPRGLSAALTKQADRLAIISELRAEVAEAGRMLPTDELGALAAVLKKYLRGLLGKSTQALHDVGNEASSLTAQTFFQLLFQELPPEVGEALSSESACASAKQKILTLMIDEAERSIQGPLNETRAEQQRNGRRELYQSMARNRDRRLEGRKLLAK